MYNVYTRYISKKMTVQNRREPVQPTINHISEILIAGNTSFTIPESFNDSTVS